MTVGEVLLIAAVCYLNAAGVALPIIVCFWMGDRCMLNGKRSWRCAHGWHAWRTESIGEPQRDAGPFGGTVRKVSLRCQRCHAAMAYDTTGHVRIRTYYPPEA